MAGKTALAAAPSFFNALRVKQEIIIFNYFLMCTE